MSFLSPDDAAPVAPPKIETTPIPFGQIQGRRPKSQNQRTTFLGADSMPAAGPGPASGNIGGKTLLGI